MARPGGVRLAPMIVIYITIELLSVQGRKCVCTSKACLASGLNTCRTRFACYTELILTDEGRGSTTTRGCTENATPLLCENRPRSGALDSRRMITGNNVNNDQNSRSRPARVRWPYLRCCNSEDYCNSGKLLDPWKDPGHKSTSTFPQNRDPGVSSAASGVPGSESEESPSDPPDPHNRDKRPLDSLAFTGDGNKAGLNFLTLGNVKPLHVATLVLAVAALISVLAACYVVTRFLKSHNHHHDHLHPASPDENN